MTSPTLCKAVIIIASSILAMNFNPLMAQDVGGVTDFTAERAGGAIQTESTDSKSDVAWNCRNVASGPMCGYNGKVTRVYSNAGNLLLLYFEEPLPISEAEAVGYLGITHSQAGAVTYKDHPAWADFFYSTILSAKASDATVSLQLRGTHNGWPVIDRIWHF